MRQSDRPSLRTAQVRRRLGARRARLAGRYVLCLSGWGFALTGDFPEQVIGRVLLTVAGLAVSVAVIMALRARHERESARFLRWAAGTASQPAPQPDGHLRRAS